MLACLKGYLLHSLARTPPCRDPIQTYRLADTVNKIHGGSLLASHSKWNESNLKWMFCVALCIHIAMQISWMPTLALKDRPNLSGTETEQGMKERKRRGERGGEGSGDSQTLFSLWALQFGRLCARHYFLFFPFSFSLFPFSLLLLLPYLFMLSLCFVI